MNPVQALDEVERAECDLAIAEVRMMLAEAAEAPCLNGVVQAQARLEASRKGGDREALAVRLDQLKRAQARWSACQPELGEARAALKEALAEVQRLKVASIGRETE